jgi:hypothetical protein
VSSRLEIEDGLQKVRKIAASQKQVHTKKTELADWVDIP